jgi:hypothetical protein
VPPADETPPAAKPRVEDDPLAAVLDHGKPRDDEPETLEDAWSKARAEVARIDLGKILDFGGLATGLRQLAGWVEQQIPTINKAVTKFLATVEETLTAKVPDGTEAAGEAGKQAKPAVTLVPDPEPGDGDASGGGGGGEPKAAANDEATTTNQDGGDLLTGFTYVPKAEGEVDPPPVRDPQPFPDPVPVHDPDPMPDPNPGTDPLPIGDPEPSRDPNPEPDRAPVRDPVPPDDPNPGPDPLPMGDPIRRDPNPGHDPLPIGDPVRMPDANPGRDPLPMGDPIIGRGEGASGGAGGSSVTAPGRSGNGNGSDDGGDPFATD